MSTHVPGFQSFFMFLHHFVEATLVTSSIKVQAIRIIAISQKRDYLSRHVAILLLSNLNHRAYFV